MSNVINLETAKHNKTKEAIRDSLKDRGGNPVSEPFLVGCAMRSSDDVALALTLITEMVNDGVLEKLYATGADASHRPYRLPMYRLAFTGW